MWDSADKMQADVLNVIQRALYHCYFSIAKKLQKAQLTTLQALLAGIGDFKKAAQDRKDEVAANAAFILERYVYGVSDFLSMWILLKENKLEKAWDSLVGAQEQIRCGLRLRELQGFDTFNNRLDACEKL